MLGPANLTTAQLTIAHKATAGYEEQLYASILPYTNPGSIFLAGPNSGVYNANNADTTALAAAPQELVAVLDGPVNSAANIVVTVTGTDDLGNPATATGTFKAPADSQTQENVFPQGTAIDLICSNPGRKMATITPGLTQVTCNSDTTFTTIQIYGLPSFSLNVANSAVAGAYRLISAKTKLDYNPRVAEPHAVQIGRDLSAQVKPGEIMRGDCTITQKVQSDGDGLMRLNGIRVTGLVRVIKEGKVEVLRRYLLGLQVSAKKSTGQSVEDVEAQGTGIFEHDATIMAGP